MNPPRQGANYFARALLSARMRTSFSGGFAAPSLAQLPHDAILDGEIVCLDQEGHPQFDELFRHHEQPYFAAFDIPHLDHRDLRDLPLIERKKELRRVVQRSDSRQLLYVSHIEGQGVALFQEVCRRDLEGIVVKWKHGPYVTGDETSWEKIKNPMYSQMIGRWDHLQRKRVGRESRTNAVSVAPRDSSAEQG